MIEFLSGFIAVVLLGCYIELVRIRRYVQDDNEWSRGYFEARDTFN